MTRGATREGRVRAALAAYALIKKRRETRAAWAAYQLRLQLERLFIRNEVVLGVIACIAMADNERRTVERASAVEGGSDEEGSSDNNRRGRGASQGVQCPNPIRTKCHMHACHVTPIHTVSRATRTPCTLPLPPAAASVVAVATLPPAAAALSLALAASLAASLAAAVALRAATVAFGATPLSPSPPRVRAAASAALALAAVSCDPPSCRPRRRPLALATRPRRRPRWSPTPPRRANAVPFDDRCATISDIDFCLQL